MTLEYIKRDYVNGHAIEITVEYKVEDEDMIRFLANRIAPGADEEKIKQIEQILWEADDLGALNTKNIEKKYAEELWEFFAEKIQGE